MNISSQNLAESPSQYPRLFVTSGSVLENQRKSYLPIVNKLELVIHRGELFIKSISDPHELLRIVVFSVMYEAFTFHTKLLDSIKRILSRDTLTVSGKQKENRLIKAIDDIPINTGVETQKSLMDLFLDFDAQIMTSFSQNINFKGLPQNELEHYTGWVKQKFTLDIIVLSIGEKSQEVDGVVLYNKKGTYMRISCQDKSQLDWVNKQQGFATPVSSVANSTSGKNYAQNDVMELSLTKVRLRESGEELNFHDSVQDPSEFPTMQKREVSIRVSSTSEGKKNKENKPFSLWDYLCC